MVPHPQLGSIGFARCEACGFVHRPDVSRIEVQAVYTGGEYERRDYMAGYATSETLDDRLQNARRRLAYVRRYIDHGRLLDVGAAGGAFVLAAVQNGFDAWGIEPSPAFVEHANSVLKVDVRQGTLDNLDESAHDLDVVTMWHVLEHLVEPVAALRRVHQRLRRGGRIVVEVPNLESHISGVMGATWTHLDPEVHVSQFTTSSLRDALARAGFDVDATTTVSVSSYATPRDRWRRGPLGERARLLAGAKVWGLEHPTAHELLRAVATRP